MTNAERDAQFLVTFDGVKDGDRDLLFAERIPEKRQAPTIAAHAKPSRPSYNPLRPHVVDQFFDQPITVQEIMQRTGLSKSTVSNRLWALRQAGLVRQVQTRKSARRPQKVWTKAA